MVYRGGENMAKSRARAKTSRKRSAAKRQSIAPRGDKRYVRRGPGGKFTESDDVSRASASDRRKHAKRKVKSGQGDKGDR